MLVEITKEDITKQAVDCVVNAANSNLKHGGGVALAIARNGGYTIQKESNEYVEKNGKVPTGEVAVTNAGKLKASYIIHAVAPIWHGGKNNEDKLLYNAVINSLRKAEDLECSSIAIPAISSGIYGFPVKRCAKIFNNALKDFIISEPSNLKIVKICDIRENVINVFKKEIDTNK
jgi:putative ATPase